MASITDSMTNVGKLDFGPQSVLEGGPSMKNGESLQTQIALAPERALLKPIIHGWPDGKGGTYSTSVAMQVVYLTQYGQRLEAAVSRVESNQALMLELLRQLVANANNGVAVSIDYAKIEAMMPKLPDSLQASITLTKPGEEK